MPRLALRFFLMLPIYQIDFVNTTSFFDKITLGSQTVPNHTLELSISYILSNFVSLTKTNIDKALSRVENIN